MKRIAAGFLAVALLFAGGNLFALTVSEEIDNLKKDVEELKRVKSSGDGDGLGINIGAEATFVLQSSPKLNDGSDKKKSDAALAVSLTLTREFSNGGTAFAELKSGIGEGLNSGLRLYSDLYSSVEDRDFDFRQLWYEQSLFDDKVKWTFGKLDACEYFDTNAIANDETEHFLAALFVNNPTIVLPDNNIGLRVSYSPFDCIDINYAYFNQSEEWDNIDRGGFNIVEADCKLSETGNYRILYWQSNEDSDDTINGAALSFDQGITEDVSLFARYGYANPEIQSWSFGSQIKGSLWSREDDAVGIAVGQVIPSQKWGGQYYSDFDETNYSTRPETQAELYYNFALNKNIVLSPVFQYAIDPCGRNIYYDDIQNKDNIFTFGLRTKIIL
jgi:carbohydrate-selective porin OprB